MDKKHSDDFNSKILADWIGGPPGTQFNRLHPRLDKSRLMLLVKPVKVMENIELHMYRVFFNCPPPPPPKKRERSSKYKKVNLGEVLGVSRTIYVNVDLPNLSSRYFNFLGGDQLKKTTLYVP